MPRSIVGILNDGNGLRVSWSDGTTHQFVWKFANGAFYLQDPNTLERISLELVEEIIENARLYCTSITLWSHLFGTAGDRISASAIGQVGDTIPQNSWTRMVYDQVDVQSLTQALQINQSTGIISLRDGMWRLSADVQSYKPTSTNINIMMHIYDETNSREWPNTFCIKSTAAKSNAPDIISISTIIDAPILDQKISVRFRTNGSGSKFGSLPADVPSGSQDVAGLLSINRLG